MLAFANMVDLLTYEFARLRRRRFAGALVGTGPLERLLLGHTFPPGRHDTQPECQCPIFVGFAK